jgi:hypothetical protein
MTSSERLATAAIACLLLVNSAAHAEEEERTTGLPNSGTWTFNFDAGVGAFGFDNSLYTDQRADPSGDLSDDWLESYIKPAVSADFPTLRGAWFGKLSAVGSRTFSAPPSLVGESASALLAEDAYIGWRSGTSMKIGEDALEITIGRAPYQIGHGLLLWDGAADGGARGGYWSGARKSWEKAGIVRFKAKRNNFQFFYVDRDELPDSDTGTEVAGINYELSLGEETTTLGVSYLKLDSETLALRDGMDVYDARIFTAPLSSLPDLSVELEYAQEDSADQLSAIAWNAKLAYTLSNVGWSPRISYRYAFFEGDDPATPESEAFDSLFPGFYDWGTWWQGEIAGEYFLVNSNLESHELRLHLEPSESVSGGLIGYDFHADQTATFAPGVTSSDIGWEVDAYLDWKVNGNFTASFVLAYSEPGEAIEQGFERTDAFTYGMAYMAYAF